MVALLAWYLTMDDYRVAKLDGGGGQVIEIFKDTWEDPAPGACYYQVRVGGRIVVPKQFIWYSSDEMWPRFTVVPGREGVVAVVAESDPYTAIILHDFKSGESWYDGPSPTAGMQVLFNRWKPDDRGWRLPGH